MADRLLQQKVKERFSDILHANAEHRLKLTWVHCGRIRLTVETQTRCRQVH